MRKAGVLLLPLCLSALSACGGGEHSGTGGTSASAGSEAGGANSSGGKATSGANTGGSATDGGVSLGGTSLGGTATGGSSGSLDTARVATARKISRRFSLGDRDHDLCIARADGGILCTIAAVQTVLVDQKVDLVTTSGLGYCVILDDKSVKCANATSDSAAAKAFAMSVTAAATLMKSGDG